MGRRMDGVNFLTLGMTVGVVYAGQVADEKQRAYQADVTYGTNNEFGFDYLRDNMAHFCGGKGPAQDEFCHCG